MSATRKSVVFLLLFTIICAASLVGADKAKKNKSKNHGSAAVAQMQMDEQKRAIHVLNRFTFGPRPGDVQKVDAMGIDNWFEQQLNPEKIDDSAIEDRLAPFRTLKMSTREIVMNFPPPQLVKAAANGRVGLPRDPQEKAIYQAAIDRERQKHAAKQDAADNQNNVAADANSQPGDDAGKGKRRGNRDAEDRMYASLSADSLINEPPDQRFKD